MTKKKRQRKEERDQDQGLSELEQAAQDMDLQLPGLPRDMRGMERVFARADRVMNEQQFDSQEEVDAFMSNNLATHGGALEDAPAPSTPLERAQELMYDAFETDDPRKRVRLAKKA